MTANYTKSWKTVEEGCRAYLNAALNTVDGATAFSEQDFPREMPSAEAGYFIWKFAINGGAVNVNRQTRTALPGGVLEMDAEFTAICSDDATALEVGGAVWQALPALAADVAGLVRLFPTAHPSRERALVNFGGAENAGQERVAFRLTVPLRAVFGNCG